MRLKLTLRPLQKFCTIPINYQYPISSAIYKILSTVSPEYAAKLHDTGYSSPVGKRMKLFVFSRLSIPSKENIENILVAKDFHPCTLYVSSPMLEDFLHNFVLGLFQEQKITLCNQYARGDFIVETVEVIPPVSPEDWHKMAEAGAIKFKCLSPIVSSVKGEDDSSPSHYLRPQDPRLPEAIRKNLVEKFRILYATLPQNPNLEFHLDQEYIDRKGGPEKISKLIHIREGEEEEISVKAFIAPFELKGSPELIHTAYECGIGEKNSLGCGMIELVGDNRVSHG